MPGIAFFLSAFYKRKELYFRVGIYVSAASMAGAFGGLLAAGLAKIPRWGVESAPIHTWRNIFFFEGLLTMIIGGLAPLILPQSPETSTWLTEREKFIAAERLRIEHRANANQVVKPHHIKRALLNINNYICAAGFFCINITVQGLSVFMPTILRDLGWTATRAQLYSVPVYVSASAIAILIAFISDKTRQRGLYLAAFTTLGITGFAMLRADMSANARYGAVYLCALGAFPGGPGFLSWGLNNAAGKSCHFEWRHLSVKPITNNLSRSCCSSSLRRMDRDSGHIGRNCRNMDISGNRRAQVPDWTYHQLVRASRGLVLGEWWHALLFVRKPRTSAWWTGQSTERADGGGDCRPGISASGLQIYGLREISLCTNSTRT